MSLSDIETLEKPFRMSFRIPVFQTKLIIGGEAFTFVLQMTSIITKKILRECETAPELQDAFGQPSTDSALLMRLVSLKQRQLRKLFGLNGL